jgi:hypothetical protein
MFLAGLLLLPFLNKPFTIDDPLFMREAKHALVDPLHPADFEQVWNAGDRLKFSQYLLGGTLPAYVLAPVAALGGREWMAHLYQFLLLCGLLACGVSVARRMGCDSRQASTVGVLIAANPVVLAMAATCMPDVMAATFGLAGMDRLLAFRSARHWAAGAGAGLLFAAAVLCRASTLPMLAAGALLVMPAAWRRAASSWWPLGLAAAMIALMGWLTRAADASLRSSVLSLTSVTNVPRNLVSFLCFQALAGPVLVYALLSRGRKFAGAVAGTVALGIALSLNFAAPNLVQYAVPAALGLCFAIACVWLLRGVPYALPLGVWLGSGLVVLPYVHLAAKYLLPGAPAAALLIVLHAAKLRQPRWPLTVAILVALGWISGALIVVGDARLAGSQRAAVERMIAPRLRRGFKVWAGGQWAFMGYAQDAGALALGNTPPLPQPGDYIVISRLDYYGMLPLLPLRKELLNTESDRRCGVFVLNRRFSAGFYSIRFGYLPFAIGCGEVNAYDLYRVLP